MLRYVNGRLTSKEVPGEKCIAIVIAGCPIMCEKCTQQNYQGLPLSKDIDMILRMYKDYSTCLCVLGGDSDQQELKEIFSKARKLGLKTCMFTAYDEFSQINIRLLDELNYIRFGRCNKRFYESEKPGFTQKLYMKDYSPFGDFEEWIDITDWYEKDEH